MWSVYEEMREAKMSFSIVTYNTLVDACARVTNMGRISSLLADMTHQGIAPNVITYSAIIKGYCREGRLDKALELFEEMKRTSCQPDEHTYNTLLNGCSRHCRYQRGVELLQEMQATGVPPSNYTLSVLVNFASRTKGVDKAFDLVRELSKQHDIRPNVHVYNNLVNACISNKDLKRALGVFEELIRERLRPDQRTYTLLLKGCVASGCAQEAAELLRGAAGQHSASKSGMKSPQALQPNGGLPSNLVWEILEGISKFCHDEALSLQLYRELNCALGLRGNPARLLP